MATNRRTAPPPELAGRNWPVAPKPREAKGAKPCKYEPGCQKKNSPTRLLQTIIRSEVVCERAWGGEEVVTVAIVTNKQPQNLPYFSVICYTMHRENNTNVIQIKQFLFTFYPIKLLNHRCTLVCTVYHHTCILHTITHKCLAFNCYTRNNSSYEV